MTALPILPDDTFKPLHTCASCHFFVDEGDDSYCTAVPERALRDADDTACLASYRPALSTFRSAPGYAVPISGEMPNIALRGIRDPDNRKPLGLWVDRTAEIDRALRR